MRLGSALSISESRGGAPWESFAAYPASIAASAGDPTPISPGEREVAVTVRIVFAIE